jgi:cytochrome c556
MEHVLNNPQTSFLKNPKVFNEIHSQSQMSMSQMFKTIGKTAKNRKSKEPTDAERSEQRLNEMSSKTEK